MTLRVSDIMTTSVVTLTEEDNLASIRQGMEDLGLRHVPVVDGMSLVGLITHRDILRLTSAEIDPGGSAARVRLAESTFVTTVMTPNPKTCTPEATIEEAARAMVEGKFGCLPVVDETGMLMGIVTEHDLLKAIVKHGLSA